MNTPTIIQGISPTIPPNQEQAVLLLYRNGQKKLRTIRARFVAKFTDQNYDGDDADYDEATDNYYTPEGWYEWNEQDDICYAVDGEPLAWIPLPTITMPT